MVYVVRALYIGLPRIPYFTGRPVKYIRGVGSLPHVSRKPDSESRLSRILALHTRRQTSRLHSIPFSPKHPGYPLPWASPIPYDKHHPFLWASPQHLDYKQTNN